MTLEALPLLLLTGFVGAGRTTLLARWLADPEFADAAVLANEPGAIPVDAALLGGARPARAIAGGCACCTARAALVSELGALALDRHDRGRAIGRVVIEASGTADPAALVDAIASLRDHFALHGVVAVVDALHGMRWLATRGEARAQVLAADAIVVTRIDVADDRAVAQLRAEVAALNPDAAIFGCALGACDAREVWDAAAIAPGRALRHMRAALEGAGAERAHDALRAHTLRFAGPVELSGFCVRLAAFLDAHGADVVRVKGLLAVQGRRGPAVIQALPGSLQPVRTLREWPAGTTSAVVVIGHALDADALGVLARTVPSHLEEGQGGRRTPLSGSL